MRQNLGNVLIVEYIYLLILCEGVIKHVHDDAGVIHHAESVESRCDAAFAPPILYNLDTAESPLQDSYYCTVLFHYFINSFNVSFLLKTD
jgi:hypothetical protein